ncbi:MAG: periplasmic heavy metal sensor [Bacteroidota bacterium]
MDIFAQKKLLIRLVIVLALLNVLSIGVFLWKGCRRDAPSPPRANQKDLSEILVKELKLNEKQAEQIKMLRSDFIEKEKVLVQKIRTGRDSMNVIMFNESANDSQLKDLARRIADNEYQMELLRISQAQSLREICNAEQLVKFQGMVREIRDYFKPDDPGGRKR